MKYKVEMRAFAKGRIRTVVVPDVHVRARDRDLSGDERRISILTLIFHYGQNDFQPQRLPSVSVGDVIRFEGKRYRVEMVGFEEVKS